MATSTDLRSVLLGLLGVSAPWLRSLSGIMPGHVSTPRDGSVRARFARPRRGWRAGGRAGRGRGRAALLTKLVQCDKLLLIPAFRRHTTPRHAIKLHAWAIRPRLVHSRTHAMLWRDGGALGAQFREEEGQEREAHGPEHHQYEQDEGLHVVVLRAHGGPDPAVVSAACRRCVQRARACGAETVGGRGGSNGTRGALPTWWYAALALLVLPTPSHEPLPLSAAAGTIPLQRNVKYHPGPPE